MKRKIFAMLLAVCVLTGSVSDTVFATTVEGSQAEPEEVTQEEQPQEQEEVLPQTEETKEQEDGINHAGGYIDVPLELPEITAEEDGIAGHKTSAVPASYDGRTNMPLARNQNPYGTCWAFAALAAGEASMIGQGAGTDLDLSEYQLAYFFYNHVDDPLGNTTGDKTIGIENGVDITDGAAYLDRGGNSVFTTWAMAGWKAGGTESKSPYDSIFSTGGRLADNLAYDDIAHLQNAYWLPFYTEDDQQQNTQRVKEMIMKYGAVASSYYHDDYFYNDGTGAYFSNYSSTNHAISIVGWDDNFSRDKFKAGYQPAGNGAWLVRNSWGTGWGESGYFWMSYEDTSISDSAFVFLFEDADNYDYNYQYDGSCGYSWLDYNNEVSLANRFDVYGESTQSLNAVSIGMYSTNTDYSIQIYKDPEQGNPISGTPMLSTPQTGTIQYTGYHTITLEKPVIVEPGHSFSVVFTLPDGGTVFVDNTYVNSNWIRFVSDTAENQSFSITQEQVSDLSVSIAASARIKAFTDVYEEEEIYTTSITKADATSKTNGKISYLLNGVEYDYETIYAPNKVVLSADTLNYTGKTVKPTVKAVYDTEGKEIAPSNYTVLYSNSSENPGSYDVEIKFIGDYYTGTLTQSYKIKIELGAVSGFKNSSQSTSAVKVSWKQQKNATGYMLYASSSKNGTYKRIATIKKNSTVSYTHSKLKSGKNVYFKIRAYKTISGKNYYSAYSSVLGSATKPGKVSGLKAGSQSSSQIKLSWKKVSGASGYQIYRYNKSKNKYEKAGTVSGTSFTDKKLKAGTGYKYKVRAYRKCGDLTAAGSYTSVLSTITKPAKVSGVKASSVGKTSLKLSWKKVSGASGYQVYRYDKAKKKYVKIATVASSKVSYTDKKLKAGTKYQYKVRAYKKSGKLSLNGSWSNIFTTVTKPAKVSGIKATSVSKTSLKLSWKKVSGASGYEIYRYNKSTKKYKKVAEIKSGSTIRYQDKSLKKNTKYQYKVRAYKKAGTMIQRGSYSNIISVKTKK